jgi:hypothetical protein
MAVGAAFEDAAFKDEASIDAAFTGTASAASVPLARPLPDGAGAGAVASPARSVDPASAGR